MYWNEEKELFIEYEDIHNEIPMEDAEIKENIPYIALYLKRWSSILWQHIYYNNSSSTKQQWYLRYKTFLDQEGEQKAIKNAIIEMTMGALTSDMHLNAYTDKVTKTMPETVNMYLRAGKLIRIGRYIGEVEDYAVE